MHRSRSFRSRWGGRAAALLVLAVAAACGENPQGPEPAPGPPPAVVASVQVTPGTVHLQVNGTQKLEALVRAADGAVLSGRQVQWQSSDAARVRVDESGNVTALMEGTVTVTAVSGGKRGEARVQVDAPPPPPAVHSVQVAGGDLELEPGVSRQLEAVLRAADGTVLHGRPVSWTSSDSTVVQVHANGLVVGLRGGTATITAVSEGKTGQALAWIPDWLRFELHSLDGQDLPVMVTLQVDTLEVDPHAVQTRERRERMRAGRVWFSTTDGGYRQLFEVEVAERLVTRFSDGSSIATAEEVVGARTIRDEGEVHAYDMWTGEAIYRSRLFDGHTFRVQRPVEGGRAIQQPLPGEGTPAYRFVFAK